MDTDVKLLFPVTQPLALFVGASELLLLTSCWQAIARAAV